ncbi:MULTISPECIES: membrane protein YpdK [Pantoea]|uniref:Membrane protein YpdK n=6 Tax=Pantoea TaxID=53335 RepID=A0A437T8I5_9GAMM|nr:MULTISPECIES: membrane protein YpdK [Pantoea]MBK4770393.1 membrane protein YpdK [Pantoea sp. Morm]MBK4785068.1 membrane protein YpdK [Pantoea sp. Pent]MBU6518207.1 membrane protein YpdK [Pantoea sp. B270]NIE53659.1 membrane protein YpdK [Pantoea sp. Ap-870]NIE70778.1 membrane protein YpdK [Pantoea sp. Acro-807]NIG14386.1 membrane protein YpdK [Pantoea sp. Cy-640]NIG35306.1 membrane protein YpdK [Pantoea sp. Ap-959]
MKYALMGISFFVLLWVGTFVLML